MILSAGPKLRSPVKANKACSMPKPRRLKESHMWVCQKQISSNNFNITFKDNVHTLNTELRSVRAVMNNSCTTQFECYHTHLCCIQIFFFSMYDKDKLIIQETVIYNLTI